MRSQNLRCVLAIYDNESLVAEFTLPSHHASVIPMVMDTHQMSGVAPVARMIETYRREQTAAGRSPKYAAAVQTRLEQVADACGWETLADVAAGARDLEDYLLELADTRSASTRNNALTAIRAWAEWLRRRRDLRLNPFDEIPMLRRHDGPGSRAFSPEEIRAMIETAEADEARDPATFGRRGGRRCLRPRSLHYRVAAWTGLRALEMERLRKRHLILGENPRIELPARATKGKRTANLPLTDDLAQRLAAAAARMAPEDFVLGPRPDPSTIASDATAAGVAPAGQIGLHSFRKGFITALAAAGAAPSVTQALARHTDPRLTERVYVEKNLLPLRNEVNRLTTAGYGDEPGRHPEKSGGGAVAPRQVCRHDGDTTLPNEPHPSISTSESPRRRPRGSVESDPEAVSGGLPRPSGGSGPADPSSLERTRQELNLPGVVARILRAIARELEPDGPPAGDSPCSVERSPPTPKSAGARTASPS